MSARGVTVLVVASAALAGAAGCSVLLDWNSLAGPGDGGLGGDEERRGSAGLAVIVPVQHAVVASFGKSRA